MSLEDLTGEMASAAIFNLLKSSLYRSLDVIHRASQEIGILVDGIRNTLAAIQGLAEIRLDDGTGSKIKQQVDGIMELLHRNRS